MANFVRMHKLVQFVDNRYKNLLEDDFMVGYSEDDEDLLLGTEEELIKEYRTESGLKYSVVVRIFKAAKEHKYLIPSPTDNYKLLVNPKDGYNLLEKWSFIPAGLIKESIKENGRLITITVGVVVAIATIINVIIVATNE
ncbi:MAG TPA: hypothetical protein VNI82_00545 [Candidatus Nitrosotenuis sp.]|nr:hypothetical protein [Candidatus Nitrosotenuis sp.]